MSQYLIGPPIQQTDPYERQEYFLQQQKRIKTILSTPLVKMSYNDYLIKKDRKILSVPLPDNSQHKEYQQIFKNRKKYQKQIKNFIEQDKTNGGRYYFYSWISNDQFCCDLPLQGVPLLATLIFSFQYEKAFQLIQNWQKTVINQTLLLIFRGFANIIKVVQNNPELRKIYFYRQNIVKESSNFTSADLNNNKLLLIQTTNLQSTLQCLTTLEQKKYCIWTNLNYIKKFLKFFPYEQVNDYYKLIFAFMSNVQDQLEHKNMYNLLLNCRQLNLLDRLNFAQKLIPLQGRKQFIFQFEKKILTLNHLSNLLFFTTKEQQKIERLIGNYLDQYGDLESVAEICLQYASVDSQNLMKYIDMYQQVLLLGSQQQKAQNLQKLQYKKLGGNHMKIVKQHIPEKLFLNKINFATQTIAQQKVSRHQLSKVCYVCFHHNQPNQGLFVECGRCRHGGHLNHLLKWYSQSNNICPKTDCSCYCV